MARTIKNKNSPLGRALGQAPSAPSAPRVSGPSTPNANQYTAPQMANKGLGGGNYAVKPGMKGGGYAPGGKWQAKTPQLAKPGMSQNVKPAPKPKPTVGPPVAVEDPMYWNNIAALNARKLSEDAGVTLAQTQADNSYFHENKRMETDRERARRNLAESLLGRGSAVYGGMHRRDDTEARADHADNVYRLSEDHKAGNVSRDAERADIASRLDPLTGTDYIRELQDWGDRETARGMDMAEQGEPPGTKKPKVKPGVKVKRLTADIKKMRARADKITDDEKRKKYRKKIQAKRRKRDNIKANQYS